MATKLFVGSLPFSADEQSLKKFFSNSGEVITANVITDRETGRSRGFGFVEMSNDDAKAAVRELNNSKMDDRTIIVKVALPKNDGSRSPSSGRDFGHRTRKFNHQRRY